MSFAHAPGLGVLQPATGVAGHRAVARRFRKTLSFGKSSSALGILSIAFLCSACGGGQTALPSIADGASPDKCAMVSTSVDFNGTAISKASWILFSSAFSVPGPKGPIGLSMRQSLITFSVGRTRYAIEGPNMNLTLSDAKTVRLAFPPFGDHWEMIAPYGATGWDFLNAIAYQTRNRLPGNITNVTWSAKFYSKDGHPIKWRWGAAAYTKLTNLYGKLETKPLGDKHYPPYNSDRAGTPEAFKLYVVGGGTGDGGDNYTGTMNRPVAITPCRG